MSHTVNLQHIVFRTYQSQTTIPNETKRMMFKYIYELAQNEKCFLVRINSFLNHVHILIDIPTSVDVASVVKKIKSNTSRVFRHHPLFPDFEGWGKRYGSFSVSYSLRDRVVEYIKNQEEHHKAVSFEEELRRLFDDNGLDDADALLVDE